MSKITSMDILVDEDGHTYFTEYIGEVPTKKARQVLWPDGAPDPSEVPHVHERCQKKSITLDKGEVRSTPYIGYRGSVFIQVMWDGQDYSSSVPVGNIERIPDAPTVQIGPKTYNLADAIKRCEPLEEVK